MSVSIRALALIGALALIASAARPDGIGNYGVLGQGTFGGIGGAILAASAPVACASPTAPDGVVDLSECSNAFYVAVIF